MQYFYYVFYVQIRELYVQIYNYYFCARQRQQQNKLCNENRATDTQQCCDTAVGHHEAHPACQNTNLQMFPLRTRPNLWCTRKYVG